MSVALRKPLTDVAVLLSDLLNEGQTLLERPSSDKAQISELRSAYLRWEAKTSTALEAAFTTTGLLALSPKSEFTVTATSLLDLKLNSTIIPKERVPEVRQDVREKLRVLSSLKERLPHFEPYIEPGEVGTDAGASPDGPIFVVHGHDTVLREQVRRFLEQVTDRDVLILAEQANRGNDILGKLLAHATAASYAVVLLTPDDHGGKQGQATRPRARQNVIFELGLFVGLLGRSNVAALNHPDVEIPTDFSGVAYIPADGDAWQIELARELKAAGIGVSLDNVL